MTEKDLYLFIAKELNLKAFQVANTVELLDSGNTVPFIARYRKEATGKLNEDQLRGVEERIKYLRLLEERKNTVLKTIEDQGKLTKELEQKIKSSLKLQEVEDLYLPYRPKKRTRATIAKEKGLEPLAKIILSQDLEEGDPLVIASEYINPKKDVKTPEEAISGAIDIIAELISEDAQIRKRIRELTREKGQLGSKAKHRDKHSEYEIYYDFQESIKRLVPHRILAINRGEKENFLLISIYVDKEIIQHTINRTYLKNPKSIFHTQMKQAISDSYKRLISPSIEREIRNELTEMAEKHAIQVFGRNLKKLLIQPPMRDKIIMGIDPAYRTGCKVAVIDETGKYLEGNTIYPHPPKNEVFEAKTVLRRLIDKYNVDIIAIGNGIASRETESLIAEMISEINTDGIRDLHYIIVNEAGASVYSASKVAKKEFPDLEAGMRGNISIARRLLDPLAELVKIDPKSIGVGLYQHDVDQKILEEKLNDVVESAVNLVGVDLNTASSNLLKYISGLNTRTAENILKYRNEHGKFRNREELNKVPGIGESVFQQSAGFLRIMDGNNQLDNTSIHPESYEATIKLLEKFRIYDKPADWCTLSSKIQEKKFTLSTIAEELKVGEPTLEDILMNLEKPGRDPRDEMPKPILRSDILKIEDLREGIILKGVVRNVVDFGAFIDIGLKRDGLIHVSEMGNKYIKDPHKIVSVGDTISVKVVGIDLERERIKLSMKLK